MEEEGAETQMDLTQQSSNGVEGNEDEGYDEELLDYGDDPTTLEHAQMADIERKVEERAAKLLDDKVVTLPGAKDDVGGNSRLSNNSSNKSSEESDEMDWGSTRCLWKLQGQGV
jgi:hypothetical protein